MSEHFNPKQVYKSQPYTSDSSLYEGTKAKIEGQLLTVESCFGKCNANFKTGSGLGPDGDICMTKCYNKFFDSSLLV